MHSEGGPPDSLGEDVVKTARLNHLLASTALGLGLILSSHAGMAQQSDKQIEAAVTLPDSALPTPPTAEEIMSTLTAASKTDAAAPAVAAAKDAPAAQQTDKTISAAVPLPDTTLPPPPTVKDIATAPAATAPSRSMEPKQDAKAPAAEPVKAASEPAAAPTPAPGAVIADALRDLLSGKRLDRFVSNKADREGAESYYRAHNFTPLWLGTAAAQARAKAAAGYIAQVDSVGLNPLDYPLPDLQAATGPAAQAEAELKFTASILAYARHAQIGQIHFTRVDADISFNPVAPEAAKVLANLADTNDVAAALDSYNPPQEGFKALKAKLAELRNGGSVTAKAKEEKKRPHVHIADGKILTKGMKDPRVIAVRQRLDVAGDKNNPLYDEAVEEAVKTFQTEADLTADGDVGPMTTRALNGEKQEVAHRASAHPIDTILVNMERWRWLPRKLGNASDTYVVVNVPDFTLSLFHDGKLFWKTKIVAGKPGKATPMTSAEMKFITVNPTWNVPPSIIQNEYLPALEADPNALERIGLKVRQDPDGTVHVYQPPGAGNALGRIRFNFPNKFLVYQHDTPDKYLFKKEKRAYSHGCMRVENPLTYATKLLSIELPSQRYNEARLEGMFGGNEINIDFPKPIPVHLTYQTAFVDNGKLQLRDDVYGRDARMIAILKSNSERKVADIAIERRPDSSSRPVRMPVGMFGNGGDSYGSSGGGDFFGWLFGGQGGRGSPDSQPYRPRGYIGGPRATNNGTYYRVR